MFNNRNIRISDAQDDPILTLIEAKKEVMCSFDLSKNCRSNCAALYILKQKGLVTRLMCNRLNACIGNLKTE